MTETFVRSGGAYYMVSDDGRVEVDPVEELAQMCGQIERLDRELSDMTADRDSESRWAETYLAKLLQCQKLLREATSNPERVTEGGVRCWEVLVSDEWMDEARKMGGE